MFGKNKKVEKLLSTHKEAVKKYGSQIANLIFLRVQQLRAVANLKELSELRFLAFHALLHDRAGQWAVTLTKNYRMTLTCAGETPRKADGSADLEQITAVVVLEPCVDYH